ncbi:hypothetical protein TNCV_166191 [Trichonephila clavipes]|nr:hypothetical protein TNCV_166191 [Trichonephila clavipes]
MLTAVPQGLGSIPEEDMDVCKCIVPLWHGGTLNSRRATSPLVSAELPASSRDSSRLEFAQNGRLYEGISVNLCEWSNQGAAYRSRLKWMCLRRWSSGSRSVLRARNAIGRLTLFPLVESEFERENCEVREN